MLKLVRNYDIGLGEAGGEINWQDTIRCLFPSNTCIAASNYSWPEYACWTSHCPLNKCIVKKNAESKCIIDMFRHYTAVDKFEYDETVDKLHSQGQATICVCSGHNSVRDRTCAMSMTPCATCWLVATLPDYFMISVGKSGSSNAWSRLVISIPANILHSHSVLRDLREMCCEQPLFLMHLEKKCVFGATSLYGSCWKSVWSWHLSPRCGRTGNADVKLFCCQMSNVRE